MQYEIEAYAALDCGFDVIVETLQHSEHDRRGQLIWDDGVAAPIAFKRRHWIQALQLWTEGELIADAAERGRRTARRVVRREADTGY